jgi:hypothetical protein
LRAPMVGMVLNDIDVDSPDYHYYNYGYSKRMGSDLYYSTKEYLPSNGVHETEPQKSRGAHA